ncbi:MAG TPA: DUF6062 family protein [Aggregatilineaceae bacterium]|nr:DUF6062 family protein [Aggregatilineaceae bacterium]
MPMKLSSRAYDLYQNFSKPGCAVCRMTLESVHGHLDSTVYEYITKPPTHEALRAARGFCPNHAWHIQEQLNAGAFGIAVLYEGVLRHLTRDMGSPNPQGGKKQVAQAQNAFKPQGECPACVHQRTVEEHLLRNLLEHFDQAEFAEGYRQSAGLCLPHLRQVLELQGDPNRKALLLAMQHEIWTRLQADLEEFIRKHDHRFAKEPLSDTEGTSPRRVIEQLAGAREIR